MSDRRGKTAKWILAALGAIAAGGLGSGFWQNVLEPGTGWLARTVLNVGSLGVEAFRDGVYRQVATNDPQAASIWVVGVITMLAGGVVGGMTAGMIGFRWLLKHWDRETEPPTLPLYIRFAGWSYTPYLVVILTFGLGGWVAVEGTRIGYIARAQAYYAQSLAAVSPHLSDQEIASFNARFATIQGRKDYLDLRASIDSVATQHQVSLPKFDPW